MCWRGYLSGARCRLAAQLMPLPLTVSCFSEIQIGFTFLVLAHPDSPGKRAVKRLCVCVLLAIVQMKCIHRGPYAYCIWLHRCIGLLALTMRLVHRPNRGKCRITRQPSRPWPTGPALLGAARQRIKIISIRP